MGVPLEVIENNEEELNVKEDIYLIDNDDLDMECDCNKNCNPNIDKWCNTIVYNIYRNDDLETLPKRILIQMIYSLEDKLNKKEGAK